MPKATVGASSRGSRPGHYRRASGLLDLTIESFLAEENLSTRKRVDAPDTEEAFAPNALLPSLLGVLLRGAHKGS
jgi:hypothetical protein